MKEFTVEFRIYGRDLDPAEITATLGIVPSLKRKVGEHRDEATNWEEAMWSYGGSSETAGVVLWPSLEEGLQFVLEKLWPSKDLLENYKQKYEMILWCGHFH